MVYFLYILFIYIISADGKKSELLRHSSTYIPRILKTWCKPGLDGKEMQSFSYVPIYAILKTHMWYVAGLYSTVQTLRLFE